MKWISFLSLLVTSMCFANLEQLAASLDRLQEILYEYDAQQISLEFSPSKGSPICAVIGKRKPDGQTPLMRAAVMCNERAVAVFLKCGANVDVRDKDGKTALYLLIQNLKPEDLKKAEPILKKLLEYKANIDIQSNSGETALHRAAYRGFSTFADSLLDAGAKQDILDNQGRAPLHVAVKEEKNDVVRIFIEKKSNLNIKTREKGETPLILAVQKKYQNIVELLLKADSVDQSIADDFGNTPLMYAAENTEKVNILEKLLEKAKDRDFDAQNNEGKTALMLAINKKNQKAIKKLSKRKPSSMIKQDKKGKTALIYAVETNNEEAVNLLLDNAKNVSEFINLSTKADATALSTAVVNEEINIVKKLLEKGANIRDTDKRLVEEVNNDELKALFSPKK